MEGEERLKGEGRRGGRGDEGEEEREIVDVDGRGEEMAT